MRRHSSFGGPGSGSAHPHRWLAVLASLWAVALLSGTVVAAPTVFKCNINGTVSYQREPCPSGEPRRSPTVQQLNAERLKKQQQAAAAAASAPAVARSAPPETSAPPASSAGNVQAHRTSAERPATPVAAFKCDGRTRCPEMKSCAEAKFFLAHCPTVQMDGDGDGIPCEKQWCGR